MRWFALGMVLLTSYFAVTDSRGNVSMPETPSQAFSRIRDSYSSVAASISGWIYGANRNMQGVVDGRNETNDSRIKRDIAPEPED